MGAEGSFEQGWAAAEQVEIERSVVEGPPIAALLGAVRKRPARRRLTWPGGFAGLLLGSVSEQVAKHAPCPVVIVR